MRTGSENSEAMHAGHCPRGCWHPGRLSGGQHLLAAMRATRLLRSFSRERTNPLCASDEDPGSQWKVDLGWDRFDLLTVICGEPSLAQRLGVTTHVSALRRKAEELRAAYPSAGAEVLEDWLVDVANARGVWIVTRPGADLQAFVPPSTGVFSNEELVVCLCQAQGLDRPQTLRLPAQLISAGAANVQKLAHLARQERAVRVLAELARLALRVEPGHLTWTLLRDLLGDPPRLRQPLLHWTRLAEPIPRNGLCDGRSWKLVA